MPVSNPAAVVKAATASGAEVISRHGWSGPDQQRCRTPCNALVALPASPAASGRRQNFSLLQADTSDPERARITCPSEGATGGGCSHWWICCPGLFESPASSLGSPGSLCGCFSPWTWPGGVFVCGWAFCQRGLSC